MRRILTAAIAVVLFLGGGCAQAVDEPMSMQELRSQLSAIEPNESTYANIGVEEIPLLRELLNDDEPWRAARAVHALSRIDSPETHPILEAAAQDPRDEVRVAVAASAVNLPPDFSDILLEKLLADPGLGVRKFAIMSVSERNDRRIRLRLQEMASSDPNPYLRDLARQKSTLLPP